jgi:hypothetical protein
MGISCGSDMAGARDCTAVAVIDKGVKGECKQGVNG